MLRGMPGIVALAAIGAAAAPAHAQASAPAPRQRLGIDLGVQAGFGWPYGRINDEVGQLNNIMSSFVPVVVDAGYRLDDRIAVGLLFQHGVLRFREEWDGCSASTPCRGRDTILAVQVTVHAPVRWRVEPWLRLGAGYEWFRLDLPESLTGTPAGASFNFRGWMFGMAQLGADFAVLPWLGVGPVVGLSVGRYNRGETSNGVPDRALVYKTMHEWLMLGVRGVFHL